MVVEATGFVDNGGGAAGGREESRGTHLKRP